jgi:hypothetical protein
VSDRYGVGGQKSDQALQIDFLSPHTRSSRGFSRREPARTPRTRPLRVRDREAPGSNSSSPWLYIQSEALQDIAFHPPGRVRHSRLANRPIRLNRGGGAHDHLDAMNTGQPVAT